MISAMPNTGLAIELQPAERTQLEQWESAHGTPQQVALRCRIILRAVAVSRMWPSPQGSA